MTETATLEAQLKHFTAFSELEPDLLHWLATNVRLFQAPVGQELLARDIPPEYCFGILDGRARLLHHDPGVRRPLTLALCQPGDLVGWAGLVRHRPCEWLTAASPLKLIGFTAETFYSLERDSAAFRSWLDASSSPSEFIDVIQPALRDRPHAEPDEREVLRRLLQGGMSIDPYRDNRTLKPDDSVIWLWNALPSHLHDFDISIGQPVDSSVLSQIPKGTSLRLLRVDRSLWESTLEHGFQLELSDESLSPSQPGISHRYGDLVTETLTPVESITRAR